MINTGIYSYFRYSTEVYLVWTENDVFSHVVPLNLTWFHPYTRNHLES